MKAKNILITGASAGIGSATARRFAKAGHFLILLARRQDKLETLREELGEKKAMILAVDLSSHDLLKKTLHETEQKLGSIDVLINNAGAAFGLDKAHEALLEDWEQCINVNITGLIHCTHALLPGMVKRNHGHIINIGSVAAQWPYPGGNVYGATKAFVHQFSLGLRADLLGSAVRVSCIEPGLVGGTEFSTVRYKGDLTKAHKVYDRTQPLQPEDIAEAIYFCVSAPPHVNINTIELMPTAQAWSALTVHRSEP